MPKPQLAKRFKALNLTVWVKPDDYDCAEVACIEMGLKPVRGIEGREGKICFEVMIPETPGWDKIMEEEMRKCRAQLGYFYPKELVGPVPPEEYIDPC